MGAVKPSGLATDARNLETLRLAAGQDPKAAAREAAKQFESLFMQQMLKSMRESTGTGALDNEASKLGTEMLDAQYASASAGRPGGLADLIARQLERQMALTPGPIPATTPANTSLPAVATPGTTPKVPEKGAAGFVKQHREAALAAEGQTGIPATFMLAQSALETGWGAKEIVGRDGTRSHNLFGIKAGANWKGPTVEVNTTEYIGGQPRRVVQKFRAYASYQESFADYGKLISESPRYAGIKATAGNAKAFAQGLQNAGYATDPEYANKLARVIDTAQRLQRRVA